MKELNEAVCGVNELGIVIIGQLRDGFQPADVPAAIQKIMGSDEVKVALVEAVKGIQLVPAEIKAATITDWVSLGATQLKYIPKLLAAFKG
jgi:hypothetical protein